MSRRNLTFVCQNCGAASARWQGKCDACGEWNTLVEEGDGGGVAGRPAGPGRAPRKGRLLHARVARRRHPRGASPAVRRRRIRPRHRRRLRARLGAADGRRPRHRQVDPADPGRRGARARRPPRGLYLRRRGGGAGAAARRAARSRRRQGRARRRDVGRGHHRHAVGRRDAAPRRHRFDPDHVDRPRSNPRPARSRRCAARRRR